MATKINDSIKPKKYIFQRVFLDAIFIFPEPIISVKKYKVKNGKVRSPYLRNRFRYEVLKRKNLH